MKNILIETQRLLELIFVFYEIEIPPDFVQSEDNDDRNLITIVAEFIESIMVRKPNLFQITVETELKSWIDKNKTIIETSINKYKKQK